MRKLISFLLALTVILSLLAVPAFASGASGVTVEMTSTPARAGGSVTLTFTVKNPSQLPIAGIQFSVEAADEWGEPTAEYPCAGKIFDENLVSFDGGIFRATGVLNGTDVTDESWDALQLTYKVPDGVPEGTTYTGSVTKGLLYNDQLEDQSWGEIGPFEVKIVNLMLGDVNKDDRVNARDALLVAQYSTGERQLDADALAVANVNGDKSINARDALKIAQYSTTHEW